MHISEGVLSAPVLIAGAALSAGGVAVALRRIDDEHIPRIAVVSSAFFVASLIHVPIGPWSAHLLLNGLAGVVLGWAAFPAILIALLLQSVLFGFGGLTVLGVNTFVMAAPAVACHGLFAWGIRRRGPSFVWFCGFVAGSGAVLLAGLLAAAAILTTGGEFFHLVAVFLAAHIPVAVIEGLVTGSVAGFLRKVKPELLDVHFPSPGAKETTHA